MAKHHRPGPQADAAAIGAKTYLPVKPCCRGHLTERETEGGCCLECRRLNDRLQYSKTKDLVLARHKRKNATVEIKAARKAYREANKERDSARAKARYAANLESERARSKAKYLKTRDKTLEYGAKWREANRERHRAACRAWALNNYSSERAAAYYESNKEMILARDSAYRKKTRDQHRARQAKRRAARGNATPPWADVEAIKKIYISAHALEQQDGLQRHVDHVIPLKNKMVCGLHVVANLRIVLATNNLRKSNKLIAEEVAPCF